MDIVEQAFAIARDPRHTRWIVPALLLADAALCALVVFKIPYTEIDWKAYIQQVATYISGERDYVKIHGDTGPLVYPGGHVYIYRLLYEVTEQGANIQTAQWIFVTLYLATLTVVMQCYRQAKVPPYIFPLLILSKRLHSIFMLRLFNDCFAVFFFFVAIYAYQKRMWTVGSLAWSAGLGVKMSMLLTLPAVGVILWQGVGRDRAFKQAALAAQLQLMLGYEFLGGSARSYLSRAFELSRQFKFEWTVNWRFVGEETFLSRPFSLALLATHVALLAGFVSTRWIRPAGVSLFELPQMLLHPPSQSQQNRISRRVTPDFVLFTMLISMIIGCLCARSLHYQFYAYIAWSTPFLLWRSGLHPVAVYIVWAAQEWAWNVFPSMDMSSMVVVGCLALTVASGWIGASTAWTKDGSVEASKEKKGA